MSYTPYQQHQQQQQQQRHQDRRNSITPLTTAGVPPSHDPWYNHLPAADVTIPRSIASKTPSPTDAELASLRRASTSSVPKRKRDVYDDILDGLHDGAAAAAAIAPAASDTHSDLESRAQSPNTTWAELLTAEAPAQPQAAMYNLDHGQGTYYQQPPPLQQQQPHYQTHQHHSHQQQPFNFQSFFSRSWDVPGSSVSPSMTSQSDYSPYSAPIASPLDGPRHERAYSVSSELDLGRATLGSDWSRLSSSGPDTAHGGSSILDHSHPHSYSPVGLSSHSSMPAPQLPRQISSGMPAPAEPTRSPHLTPFFAAMAGRRFKQEEGEQDRRASVEQAAAIARPATAPESVVQLVSPLEPSSVVSTASNNGRSRASTVVLANTAIPEYDTRAPSLCPDPPQSDFQSDDISARPRLQLDKLRFPGDRYTPRWVRRDGKDREGWCDKCATGGWFRLKVSAYWFHQQFTHGTSSVTGLRFEAPLQMRKTMARRRAILEGLCPACNEWHRTSTSSSKPNWAAYYKHAHSCHAAATSARAKAVAASDASADAEAQADDADADEATSTQGSSSRRSTPVAHDDTQKEERPRKRINSNSDASSEGRLSGK